MFIIKGHLVTYEGPEAEALVVFVISIQTQPPNTAHVAIDS